MSKVINIIIPDDNPSSVKIIEIANFSGKAFVIPRGNLKDVKTRFEADFPAVYYLFGEGKNESRKLVYIGESEKFYSRLSNHDTNKDFWDIAIVFSGGLDRADVKYIENQSVMLAKKLIDMKLSMKLNRSRISYRNQRKQ